MKRNELIKLVKAMIELSAKPVNDLVKISDIKVLRIIKFIEAVYHAQLFETKNQDNWIKKQGKF
jgi:hypothetical protein